MIQLKQPAIHHTVMFIYMKNLVQLQSFIQLRLHAYAIYCCKTDRRQECDIFFLFLLSISCGHKLGDARKHRLPFLTSAHNLR